MKHFKDETKVSRESSLVFYYAGYTCSCYVMLFLKRCEQMSQIGI